MAELQQESLPPGWESKIDSHTGKQYYINHYTKTTTWDDPRSRHRSLMGTPKHTEHIPLQEFRGPKMSPLTVRSAKVQDSSLTAHSDSDEAVAKISAMFPTVSESHIRLLMKNCRYMKSIFPEAEETVILEVLYGNESNIQKTSEVLKEMGFQRKNTLKMAQQAQAALEKKKREEAVKKEQVQAAAAAVSKVKTAEEKVTVKNTLKEKYNDVADHLITIALESVDFNENKACQILDIMVQENNEKETENNASTSENDKQEVQTEPEIQPTTLPISQSRQSIKSLLKSDKIDKEKTGYYRVVEESTTGYNSPSIRNTKGPNPDLIQGTNHKLLLEDYVKWQGHNPGLRKGPQSIAKGPNKTLLGNRTCQPCGPDASLRKGPKFGLAQGSIFSQLKIGLVGESRGK